MQKNARERLSTEPYKGVRDFYPEDMFVFSYLMKTLRETVESFGFKEYSASVLEPTELYLSKSSQEIVNEQTYTFTDRGGRSVTLRPEMTPTVARLVAGKRRDLAFPLRWYSIPNVFRYERPQRGRLREHWQLNCDIFGVSGRAADREILLVAASIMRAFGARAEDFMIRVNDRAVLAQTLRDIATRADVNLNDETLANIIRLLDKKDKMDADAFGSALKDTLGDTFAEAIIDVFTSGDIQDIIATRPAFKELTLLVEEMKALGVENIEVYPELARGFDYYTGMVFEVFDTNSENRRSLFGGGRYDELLSLFDNEHVPAIGFGMGDVTLWDFLESHGLLPPYTQNTILFIGTTDPSYIPFAQKLAAQVRATGSSVVTNITEKKVGDQMRYAEREGIPFVTIIGQDEITRERFRVRNMETGIEQEVTAGDIPLLLKRA